jgi:AbrB family looped-hinge helix DNA binding protein
MGKRARIVRLSSKGQLVVPAELRRRSRLRAGDALLVRPGGGRDLVFTPVEDASRHLAEMLRQARTWFSKWEKRSGRDPLRELHERRRKEREAEGRDLERWSD